MSEPIVNKVKNNTKLLNFDLEAFYPGAEIVELDIQPFLFQGLILKENDFREHLDNVNWEDYQDKILAVYCSTDAIIPPWAYMLITSMAKDYAKTVFISNKKEALISIYRDTLDSLDWSAYQDKFVMIKGCSDKDVPDEVYAYATNQLMDVAKKIMYGEACSNVPIWRK